MIYNGVAIPLDHFFKITVKFFQPQPLFDLDDLRLFNIYKWHTYSTPSPAYTEPQRFAYLEEKRMFHRPPKQDAIDERRQKAGEGDTA